jgi:hypothetical protein
MMVEVKKFTLMSWRTTMIKVTKSLKSSQDKMANMVHEMYNIMNH